MKICLNFLNCHLAKASSSLFSCVTNGSKHCQAVAGETGCYTMCLSHYCVAGSPQAEKANNTCFRGRVAGASVAVTDKPEELSIVRMLALPQSDHPPWEKDCLERGN